MHCRLYTHMYIQMQCFSSLHTCVKIKKNIISVKKIITWNYDYVIAMLYIKKKKKL